MSELTFICPHCQGEVICDEEWLGAELDCPLCQNTFLLSFEDDQEEFAEEEFLAEEEGNTNFVPPVPQLTLQTRTPPLQMNLPQMPVQQMPVQQMPPQITPLQKIAPPVRGGGMGGMAPGMAPGMPPGAMFGAGPTEIQERPKDIKPPLGAKIALVLAALSLLLLGGGLVFGLDILLGIGLILDFLGLFISLGVAANRKLYAGFRMYPTPKKVLRLSGFGSLLIGLASGFLGGWMFIWCTAHDIMHAEKNEEYVKKFGIVYYHAGGCEPVFPSDVKLHYVGNNKYEGTATFKYGGKTYTRSIIAFDTHLFVSELVLIARFREDFNDDPEEAKEFIQAQINSMIRWISIRHYGYSEELVLLQLKEIKVTSSSFQGDNCRVEVLFHDPVNNAAVKGFLIGENISYFKKIMAHDGKLTEQQMYKYGEVKWDFKLEEELKREAEAKQRQSES